MSHNLTFDHDIRNSVEYDAICIFYAKEIYGIISMLFYGENGGHFLIIVLISIIIMIIMMIVNKY